MNTEEQLGGGPPVGHGVPPIGHPNHLSHNDITDALYDASMAGAEIDLILCQGSGELIAVGSA